MMASWLLMGKVLPAPIQSGLYGQVWAEEGAAPKQNMLAAGQKAEERPSQTEKTNGCRQPLRAIEEKNGAKSWG